MLDITAANTRNLPTSAGPRPPKTFDKRIRAFNAAVAEIGPHARDGFEFTLTKIDGRWIWRACDEVRPDTAAEIKANGGKKAAKLPIPPRKNIAQAPKAPEKAAGASDGSGATEQPPAPETAPAATVGEISVTEAPPAADGLDVPPFLKRPAPTTEERDALIAKAKRTTGPGRKIKNPPNVAPAKAKAPRGQSKTAMVGQMLLDPRGCTTADILKATGWPSVSVPAQAKAVGLGLRKEKDGSVTRYFGVPLK